MRIRKCSLTIGSSGIIKGNKLGEKAAAAAKSSPKGKSGRETSLEEKAALATKRSPEWRSWRETRLGDKAAAAAKSSPEWRS